MPNHVTNRLTVRAAPEKVKEIFAAIGGRNAVDDAEMLIDFNRIIPYPEKFRRLDEISNAYEKEHPGDWNNRPKDGYNQCGYEWCIQNWGTKWNAYDQYRLSENVIRFDTAWSAPRKIMDALAARFPDAFFKLEYCDEDDTGSNAGVLLYKDGKTNEGGMSGACASALWYDLQGRSPEEDDRDPDLYLYPDEE